METPCFYPLPCELIHRQLSHTASSHLPMPLTSLSPCLPCLRHLRAPHRTTIKLEKQFWVAIDLLAEKTGRTWSEWVATELVGKPVGIGAASWLRVRCLIHSTQGA